METPEEMLSRLERMGEARVRGLIASGHFAPKAMGLVKGWLGEKEKASVPQPPAPAEPDLAARKAAAAVKKATDVAAAASRLAVRAHRLAIVAIVIGGAGLLAAILTLFAMALR